MAATRTNGGDSAPPIVLPFPQSKVRRKRVRGSMEAAGLLSLLLLDREGIDAPPLVVRFDQQEALVPEPSAALMLAHLIWAGLPKRPQEAIRSAVRCAAFGQNSAPAAVELHNLLSGRL